MILLIERQQGLHDIHWSYLEHFLSLGVPASALTQSSPPVSGSDLPSPAVTLPPLPPLPRFLM